MPMLPTKWNPPTPDSNLADYTIRICRKPYFAAYFFGDLLTGPAIHYSDKSELHFKKNDFFVNNIAE